jgi:ABC-type transport system involved in multi-copper enzyme maturation permease subunit
MQFFDSRLPSLFAVNFEAVDAYSGRLDLWACQWLSGFWVLGLGCLVGVVLLAVLLGIGTILSKIPFLGGLAESKTTGRAAWIVLTAVAFVPLAWLAYLSAKAQWAVAKNPISSGDQITQMAVLLLVVLVFAAFAALAVLVLMSRRTSSELGLIFGEGAIPWFTVIVAVLAVWGVVGIVAVKRPSIMLESLVRWPANQAEYTFTKELPAPDVSEFADPPAVKMSLVPQSGFVIQNREVQAVGMESNETLLITTVPPEDAQLLHRLNVSAGEAILQGISREGGMNPFEELNVGDIYVKNMGDKPATLTIKLFVTPAAPEMLMVPLVAGGVVFLFLLYLVHRTATPKLAAVALATTKSEMSSPLFLLLLCLGVVLLAFFPLIPYNTFGEDVKMLKDTGLSLMLVFCLLQAFWTASSSVADEIDGKTALTVLSKPVSRRDFVLGKFVGIAWLLAAMFAVYSVVYFLGVAYKPIYDAREGGSAPTEVTWQLCFSQVVSVMPGVALIFMESLVLAAISVAISTRLPMLANFSICFAIYVLGHLTPLLIQSQAAQDVYAPVLFMAKLIGTLLPVLDFFSIEAAIAADKAVPFSYLLTAGAYCVIYSAVAMLLALVLFEDRDLA